MAKVTDLTGTTWRFGEYLKANYTTPFSYNVSFNIAMNHIKFDQPNYDVFSLENGSWPCFLEVKTTWSKINGYGGHGTFNTYVYMGASGEPRIDQMFRNDFEYLDITFTGGEDATNADLIAWLEANATLVEEEPEAPATAITYNDSIIATLEAGQTATIKTAETEVEHDITIIPAFPINIAYGDIIANAIIEDKSMVACAGPGFRTIEIRYMLEDDFDGTDPYMFHPAQMNAVGEPGSEEYRTAYKKAIAEADLITLGVGGNDWGAFLGWVVDEVH